MKKKCFTLALGALTGFTFIVGMVGCTRDASDLIIGTWQRTGERIIFPDEDVFYSMLDCMGCDSRSFTFKKDNTGMAVSRWIGTWGESCTDTMYFTYTIDGDNGVITRVSDNQIAPWPQSYYIQDITAKKLTILDSLAEEGRIHHAVSDTGYVAAEKIYHYCEKK